MKLICFRRFATLRIDLDIYWRANFSMASALSRTDQSMEQTPNSISGEINPALRNPYRYRGSHLDIMSDTLRGRILKGFSFSLL